MALQCLRKVTLTDDCGTPQINVLTIEDNTPPVYQGPGQIDIPAHLYQPGEAYAPDVVWSFNPQRSTLADSSTRTALRHLEQLPNRIHRRLQQMFSCEAMDMPISVVVQSSLTRTTSVRPPLTCAF